MTSRGSRGSRRGRPRGLSRLRMGLRLRRTRGRRLGCRRPAWPPAVSAQGAVLQVGEPGGVDLGGTAGRRPVTPATVPADCCPSWRRRSSRPSSSTAATSTPPRTPAQEALLAAARHWPTDGAPDNPRASLIRTAVDRVTDVATSAVSRGGAVGDTVAASVTRRSAGSSELPQHGDRGDERQRSHPTTALTPPQPRRPAPHPWRRAARPSAALHTLVALLGQAHLVIHRARHRPAAGVRPQRRTPTAPAAAATGRAAPAWPRPIRGVRLSGTPRRAPLVDTPPLPG
jgi:hypothetical protein